MASTRWSSDSLLTRRNGHDGANVKTTDVRLGDEFIYTTPTGREITYTVDALQAETRQGAVMPRSRSASGQVVFIHNELLAQEWWRPREVASDEDRQ